VTYNVRHAELDQLTSILGREAALKLSTAPGGWRSLSVHELHTLRLSARQRRSVIALQDLVARSYPKLELHELASAESVARVYADRLAGLTTEVVLAIAVDGRNRFLAEVELAKGGTHGAALLPADVFRPLIRSGASAFILLHNHPSGDASPSAEDVEMTRAVATVGDIIGLPLLDHVIVGARGGGWASLLEIGALEPRKEMHSERQVAE
jgi:DNA repair protein RadC